MADTYILELLRVADNVKTVKDFETWDRECAIKLRVLRERCCRVRKRINTGYIQSALVEIARLEGLRRKLRQRFLPSTSSGGGGPSTSTSSSSVIETTTAAAPATFGVLRDSFSNLEWIEVETAFKRRVLTGIIINRSHIEPQQFLSSARDLVFRQVRMSLDEHNCVKVNFIFNGEFTMLNNVAHKSINTSNTQLLPTSDLLEWYEVYVIQKILTSLEEFQERDSGWALSVILNLIVNINKCNPFHAGCHVRIPKWIEHKKSIKNVHSDDNACFAWAVMCGLFPTYTHGCNSNDFLAHYSDVFKWDGIKFPIELKDITLFERLNDISVNVFTQHEKKRQKVQENRIVPLRLTTEKRDQHVNLFYILDEVRPNKPVVGHYVCIRNLSRLLSRQYNKSGKRKYICDRCLHYFTSQEKLTCHVVDCGTMNDSAIVLPQEEDKWLKFMDRNRKEKMPFVVYADMECILEKQQFDQTANMYPYQRHSAYSMGMYIQCVDGIANIMSGYKSYRGDDCVTWFVIQLKELAEKVINLMSTVRDMLALTYEELQKFNTATSCHICKQLFSTQDIRVRDHCHLTGRFRGAAHMSCNLNYKNVYVIPVFFHNLSGYDAHFIIERIANVFDGTVELLPINKEKYISFTKYVVRGVGPLWQKNVLKLRFVDSYRFLSESLDKLVSYLDRDKMHIMHSEFSDLDDDDFSLLTRKGVFPYEYIDSPLKLFETNLPSRTDFYSSLAGDTVSENDYEHARMIWTRFHINNLGEYSDLYLKTDVLLLADVFENFRNQCLQSYELDPAYYYTLPGYTWDAMLKYTNIKLELLTDIDMLMFVERGIRGGLSQCSARYALANNVFAPRYDSTKPSTYLMYYDVNNLYGWAMCEPLPYANFQWVETNIENFDVMSVKSDNDVGYILEVDLVYPHELHDYYADLPFCPMHEVPFGGAYKKLLATLYNKTRYVIHYRNLQQCMKYGVRLTKIHRILQFSQSPWLRGYIELNTNFRKNASNDFEKSMYKLMINAVFGKTIENVRKHLDVRLVTRWDGRFGAEVMIAKPNFHSRSIFTENLMAVQLRRLLVKIVKPVYVGMSILEISKICLYDFHYGYMKPLFNGMCRIMYTDTDSLIYFIECENIYELIKRDIDRFDTSDYDIANPYGIPLVNKKVLGLMKDENNGAIMTEFVGLRAKMYAYRVLGQSDMKRIKGVKKSVVMRDITFNDYIQSLIDYSENLKRQSSVRSILHIVYTVSVLKVALSPFDNKRYLLRNGTADTLPWGHCSIPALNLSNDVSETMSSVNVSSQTSPCEDDACSIQPLNLSNDVSETMSSVNVSSQTSPPCEDDVLTGSDVE